MKRVLLIWLLFLTVLGFLNQLHAQDLNDTSKIIIKRVIKMAPSEYNISDIHLKKDKNIQNTFVIRVDIDVPYATKLKLSVKDTSDAVIMYLINDEIIPSGTYRVRWEMPFCKTVQNCEGYIAGRYICEFETDQFIYAKDFFLK